MVLGIFLIALGSVLLIMGSSWAENIANKFRGPGSNIDPAMVKVVIILFGLAAVVFGLVKVTAALSTSR